MGCLDELNGVLGLARFYTKKNWIKQELLEIQKGLISVGADIAADSTVAVYHVEQSFIDLLEEKTNQLNQKTTTPQGFILPGDSPSSAYINLSRTFVRRAERACVKLYENKELTNIKILTWLNRLSVYLYLLTLQEEPNPPFV